VFSWAGNPGVGSLHSFRSAVESGRLEIEEYSHFGLAMRLFAGAANLPFMPLRNYYGCDLPRVNRRIRPIANPYDASEELYAVPALRPDVAILHAQRADEYGNVQVWGLTGVQREAAFASRRVIVTVEEIVPQEQIRTDPNRTLIPGLIVSAVCAVPYGAHPSYAQGYYDRDTEFYLAWDALSRDPDALQAWLDEWVYGLPDRAAYVQKLGAPRVDALRPEPQYSDPVNYGSYR
jgi:glutaconate CoA-transferase subunit A